MALDEPVFVALGSNLGDSPAIIRRAMDRLEEFSARPLRRSSLWKSAPVDCPPGSPPFINAVVEMRISGNGEPTKLLRQLQRLEAKFGRQAQELRNAPRPLDLDLIAYGGRILIGPELTLPHPRARRRRFVLEPLAEIAPDFILPGLTATVSELLRIIPPESVHKISEERKMKNV